ncbi:MAG: diaminopimelate decarboxylase, partial [Thermodesulfobacteriota bacterium]
MSFSVHYKNDELFMENVPVREIADSVGTPCFVYSYQSIADNFRSYHKALSDIDPIICFSTKANSNLAVLSA